MSASSFCVTCGIDHPVAVQEGARELLDARQRLRLDRPELGEIDRRQRRQVEARARRRRQRPRGRASAGLTNACTSSLRMRPSGPLPFTLPRSTPSSRAKRRTTGSRARWRTRASSTGAAGAAAPALGACCARRRGAVGAAPAQARLAQAALRRRCSRWRGRGGALGREAACARRASAASADSSTSTSEPSETLSPTLTLISFTDAAARATALPSSPCRDSSVTSESSALTLSPGFTNTSMTGTSLKSPMSGTLTSMVRQMRFARCLRAPYTVAGLGFSGSMPYFLIASAHLRRAAAPPRPRALSARRPRRSGGRLRRTGAAACACRERPKPSVPSTTIVARRHERADLIGERPSCNRSPRSPGPGGPSGTARRRTRAARLPDAACSSARPRARRGAAR